ncbi:MAG TPA: hypothetical protein VLF40_06620 [Candidatus Saccharimonadales bacterium]|nr:hypothetical protein [Candidatus Saccharimonadales bacterium]
MHVIAPERYQAKPEPKPRRWRWFVAIPAVVIAVGLAANYLRPLPTPVATLQVVLPKPAATPQLAWPGSGQAAAAAEGYGLLGTSGTISPLATASTTKVILALCVLQKHPLAPGQNGATYTIGAHDVALYQAYADVGGSLLPVTSGEKLTEYQALRALMIPSANNIADSLVAWVFGSHDAYSAYATNFLQKNGMSQTHIGNDASGMDASTTSTASDLTTLGLLALKNPVLMEIAGQKQASFPVAGLVDNYNTVLGQNGITGLKTGNSDEDPGAFIFTANASVGDTVIPLAGAVMGAPDLGTALQSSVQLVASLQQGFEPVAAVAADGKVGSLQAAWGATSAIVAEKPLTVVRWKSTPLTETHTVDTAARSGRVGSLKVSSGRAQQQTALKLAQPLPGPSFWWRLTRH